MATNYDSWDTLYGKILERVEHYNDDTFILTFTDNTKAEFYHDQDCCEDVYITGFVSCDRASAGFTPYYGMYLTSITESTIDKSEENNKLDYASYTKSIFTFNWCTRAQTRYNDECKQFEVHWLGTSNGYYSEGVNFRRTYIDSYGTLVYT